jgi:hypothetical protein
MAELTTCANCDNEVTEDSDFCPHCGYLFKDAPPVKCETDIDQEASGVCIICQKLVCPRCREVKNNRLFCVDHRTVVVEQDWAMVVDSRSIAEAEMRKNFLDENGFQTVGYNLGIRGRNRSTARVFVPIPDYLRAVELIKEIDRTEPTVEGVDRE